MLAPNAKLRAMVVPQEPEPPPAQQAKPVECEANCAHHRPVRLSSHRYRASAGVRAINELRPLIGLELTATPFVETTKGPVRIPEKIRKRYGKDIGKRYWGQVLYSYFSGKDTFQEKILGSGLAIIQIPSKHAGI